MCLLLQYQNSRSHYIDLSERGKVDPVHGFPSFRLILSLEIEERRLAIGLRGILVMNLLFPLREAYM